MADNLAITVQPQLTARPGETLNPPLTVMMKSVAAVNGYSSDLSKVWALTTLINVHDKVESDQLTGTLAESARTLSSGDGSSIYFIFDALSITSIGSFRIRVTLMEIYSNSSETIVEQQIESNTIVVDAKES
jgi:hypothetical protein